MDFKKYFLKLSKLSAKELDVALFLALYSDSFNAYGDFYKRVLDALNISEWDYGKATKELDSKKIISSFYYTGNIRYEWRVPVLAYVAQKPGPSMVSKFRSVLADKPSALRFYEIVDYAFSDGPNPGPNLMLASTAKFYVNDMDVADEKVMKFIKYFGEADLVQILSDYMDTCHVLGKQMPVSLFTIWEENFKARYPKIGEKLEDMRVYHQYVQDGIYEEQDPKKLLDKPYSLAMQGIRACNMGDYEGCLEYMKIASGLYVKEDNPAPNVPPLFFANYFAAASCVHLDTAKSRALVKKYSSNACSNRVDYCIPSVLAGIVQSPTSQVNAHSVRYYSSSFVKDEYALSVRFLVQMIGEHFEVSECFHTTGQPAYAIVRHEIEPLAMQPDLIPLYGDKPAVLTIPYKKKWEVVLDNITQKLTSATTATAAPEKCTRRVYVLDEYTNEVYPLEQNWLKSQRWGVGRALTRSTYSLAKLKNPDKYDEAFAAVCKKTAYYWPNISTALPALKGCDRLYLGSRGKITGELQIEDAMPYVSIDKKGDSFVVSSNLMLSDLVGDSAIKKDGKGKYVHIPISSDVRMLLTALLSDVQTFPIEAEEKLRSVLGTFDEVIEVRSKLLDRKAMPVYPGRPMVTAKMQPMGHDRYEVNFYAQPLPDSTNTPHPGEGRKEILDKIGEMQVRVARDLDGERDTYNMICKLLDGISGIDFDEDDFRAIMPIEAVLDFMGWVQEHPDTVSIDWLQGKSIGLMQASGGSWNVGLVSNNGWFDIEGDLKVDDQTVLKMSEILELVQENKGKYLRLRSGDFLAIDKRLRRQLERIEALAVKNHNKLQISQFNAALLDDNALDGEFKVQFDQKLIDLQKRIQDSGLYTPEVPKTLNAELRPYQVDGFQWMARLASWGAGACLADDMGLGKTVQTIAFLLLKASEGPALVVAPASVVPNWQSELERFAPSLRVAILNKAEDRTATITDAKDYDVVLSTYGLLNTEEKTIVEKKWTTICLDEAHTIKNRETKMSHVAMQLQSEYRIILTGTPIQNHLGELWNLFRFINPGLLGGFDTFKHKFVKPISEDNDKNRRKSLQSIIKPFMLRRTKTEVIDDLPEKNEIIVPVELSERELARYEVMRRQAAQEIEVADKVDINTLAEITRLRRAACSMQLVDDKWDGDNSKVQAFLDIVSDFKGDGRNRMLVFSQFTSFFDIVRKALDRAGERYLYLDGSTTMKQREQLVAQFRNGDVPLFLISLKAGGLGLNLPEANYVLHLDPWWNPAIEQQATDRAYRIGQKRDVTVYHLVAKNTIEEKIRRLHRTKRDLADSLLEGTDMAGKLTVKDILELLAN